MDATAAKESKPFIMTWFPLLLLLLLLLPLLRAGFAVAARGWATGGKCGKEGNDGALGMLMLLVGLLVGLLALVVVALVLVLVLVMDEVSILELVLSVFTTVPLMWLWG
jgi:hypothetical protein